MRKIFITMALLAFGLVFAGQAPAHTPMCDCFDNGDDTVTCEGGFSDGSSAAGVVMHVMDSSGKALLQGKMNQDSEFTFEKPDGPYKVKFDAGEGHKIEINGEDIVE